MHPTSQTPAIMIVSEIAAAACLGVFIACMLLLCVGLS